MRRQITRPITNRRRQSCVRRRRSRARCENGPTMSALSSWWLWLRENDAPNWFSITVGLIIWPFFIVWLDKRKRLGIPHLEIILRPSQTIINGIQHSAVSIIFTNRTGSVVYLSRARLREVQ